MRGWGACLPETEGAGWWGAEVAAEWFVGAVCLGYSAFLDMVGGLLFQEFPSVLWVVSHGSCDWHF